MKRRIFGAALACFGYVAAIWWMFWCVEFLRGWWAFPAGLTGFLICCGIVAIGTAVATFG